MYLVIAGEIPRSGMCMKTIHDQRYIEVIALLRKARERAGHTQGEVARMLGRPPVVRVKGRDVRTSD